MTRKPTIALSLHGTPDLYRSLAKEARACGWQTLDLRLTRYIIPTSPAPIGAIINYWPKESLVVQCEAIDCPIVKLESRGVAETDDRLHTVRWDEIESGRLGADYFANRGLRNLAYVGNSPWAGKKCVFEAFRDRSEELGCTVHLLQLEKALSDDSTKQFKLHEKIIGDWLVRLPKPVGILGYHDLMSSKICSICMMRELLVPEQVAILGTGNRVTECEMSPVPLSSIDLNMEEVARRAMAELKHLIDGTFAEPSPIPVMPKGVVERRSTDTIGMPDSRVAAAVRYLWAHLDWPINVEDVVQEVGGSRRSLERAFREHLGRGIKEELLRKRLEKCAKLLLESDMTIGAIASELGIESLAYLHKKFRQTYGMTPRQYRRNQVGNTPSES